MRLEVDGSHVRSSSAVSANYAASGSKGTHGPCAVVLRNGFGVGQEGERNGEESASDEEETMRWVDEIYE